MTTELQNISWYALPKEARNEIRESYNGYTDLLKDKDQPQDRIIGFLAAQTELELCFGKHNLIGEKEFVVEPTKEAKPKFSVGQKVVIRSAPYNNLFEGKRATIKTVKKEVCGYIYTFEQNDQTFREDMIEPYESPFKPGDQVMFVDQKWANDIYTVEEVEDDVVYINGGKAYHADMFVLFEPKKEEECKDTSSFNLYKLLNSLGQVSGIKVYNPTFGEGTISSTFKDKQIYVSFNDSVFKKKLPFWPSGTLYMSNGEPSLWPNNLLYKKYPFDVEEAWKHWATYFVPESYWRVCSDFSAVEEIKLDRTDTGYTESNFTLADKASGNRFGTREEAIAAMKALKECMLNLHK